VLSKEAFHPLAFDMPFVGDTGFVPAEMITAMSGQQEASKEEKEENTSEEVEEVEDEHSQEHSQGDEVVDSVERFEDDHCHHRRRMFKSYKHVYRMRFDGEPIGIKDRDAASQGGIMGLITGGDASVPKHLRVTVGWGLNRYYHNNGILELTHVSYTQFGPYQSCNAVHPGQPGSPHHCTTCTIQPPECCCSSLNSTSNPSAYALPGLLKTPYTKFGSSTGEWYSFNGDGYQHTWNQFECPSKHFRMTTLIEKLKVVGKCGHCSGANIPTCAACLRKIPASSVTKIFHELFHLSSRRRRSKFTGNASAGMGNESASMAVIV